MIGFLLLIFGLIYLSRNHYYNVTLIFIILITGGLQVTPLTWLVIPEIGITKSYDMGLILLLIYIITRWRHLSKVFFLRYFKWIRITFYFVIIVALVSLLIYGYSISSVVRVLRIYLFLLSFLLLFSLSYIQIKKLLVVLIWICFFQSIIYILQNPFHMLLLNGGLGEVSFDGIDVGGITRYYNIPVILVPCYLGILILKKEFSKYQRVYIMLIFLAVLLLCMHRSLLFGFVTVAIIKHIIDSKHKLSLVLYVLLVIPIVFFIYTALPPRIQEGIDNISSITNIEFNSKYVENNYVIGGEQNTTRFRLFHFMERFYFIIQDPMRTVFGLGFLTEDSSQTRGLNFIVGLKKADDNVNQIDTGDIAWSRLILHLGLVGTVIYITLIFKCLALFYTRLKINPMAVIGFLYLILEIIISFFGTEIASPYFFMFLGLFLVSAIKYRKEKFAKMNNSDASTSISNLNLKIVS